MRSKLIAAVVSVVALAVPATAMADGSPGGGGGSGGSGQAQLASQLSATLQGAVSSAKAHQNAVNANTPVTVAGGDVTGGDNSANQNANNNATSSANNQSDTHQSNTQQQNAGSDQSPTCGCGYGDGAGQGGSGQAQINDQKAATLQLADSKAKADQNAVNGNAPVTTAGGDVTGGDNSANQDANNNASSTAGNQATTDQSNSQSQTDPPSSCLIGCGGNGQAQLSSQKALTGQLALSKADAKQNTVNANVPVTIAGGDVWGGSNSANQNASNNAASNADNASYTDQSNNQSQTDPPSSCLIGCGGNGQAQVSTQKALTLQGALSSAHANQNAVNANVPVTIAGGDVSGGSNSANQTATNGASSNAGNQASTDQINNQTQTASPSGCLLGCGGTGQAQISSQKALTGQLAVSKAFAKQNAVNANVPVIIAGGNVWGGSNSANQTSSNGGTSGSNNGSSADQNGGQTQSS